MTDVKIFADYIEENAVSQVKKIAESPAFAGEAIRIMPDAHSGSGCVVGFTSTFRHGRVIPAVVGVDIGCGVLSVETTLKAAEKTYKKLDKVIRSYIPTGIEHFDEPDEKTLAIAQNNLTFKPDPEATVLAARSLGTLGGGNHFIELDQHPDTKRLWLTVHTGSRNLGLQIARHHQEIASEQDGFLEGDFAVEYLHDLAIAQQFAQDNRRTIVEAIGKHMGFNALSEVESVHNYIDLERKVTRKGAIAAYEGQPVVVPLNMAARAQAPSRSSWSKPFAMPWCASRSTTTRQARKYREAPCSSRSAREPVLSNAVSPWERSTQPWRGSSPTPRPTIRAVIRAPAATSPSPSCGQHP